MKTYKSIAERAIRHWMAEQGFFGNSFELIMSGRTGVLKDANGDEITLVYDGVSQAVYQK